jgi:hypothetical protein
METKQSTAYELFVEVRAAHTGKSTAEVQMEITPEVFEMQLNTLHRQYMNHEFTLGKLADLLEVPALNLVDILDAMDLPVRQT